MAKTQLTKTDYSLAIRYQKSDGQWSEWKEYGKGQFQSIEIIQFQMRMISANYLHRDKQIKFEKEGKLCNWKGEVTGKLIDVKNIDSPLFNTNGDNNTCIGFNGGRFIDQCSKQN